MKKFFVMTRGRTGSTVILDELSKVKNVSSAAHELFLKMDFSELLKKYPNLIKKYGSKIPFELWLSQEPWWRRLQRRLPGNDKKVIARYLARVEAASTSEEGTAAFGFKALSSQFQENPLLKDILLERGYRAIYLKRNIPRQVISGMIAKQRGIYNTKKDFQDEVRYHIDVNEFRELLKVESQSVENDLAFLKAAGFRFIEVSYEEFMADRQAFFERVLGFIGVDVTLPESSSYSVMIKDLRHTVENYQAVADCAAETGMGIE